MLPLGDNGWANEVISSVQGILAVLGQRIWMQWMDEMLYWLTEQQKEMQKDPERRETSTPGLADETATGLTGVHQETIPAIAASPAEAGECQCGNRTLDSRPGTM